MKTRIRDRWRNPGQPESAEKNGQALGYVCWQLALTAARNLHVENFIYQDDVQRVAVIREYLVFLVHAADRLAFDSLAEHDRATFVAALAHACAGQFHRNAAEVLGSGDYRVQFIDTLNRRNGHYGACSFSDGVPGYALLRAFSDHIQEVMGSNQTNRWVM
ncbi:MAG TPA: hypothetical protein DHW07_00140, partial [Gammaproteobacteria bacterium]|nr:hypothetical protein [Gammaproteobacteria bacterium]